MRLLSAVATPPIGAVDRGEPSRMAMFAGGAEDMTIADSALPGKEVRALNAAGVESVLTYPQTTPKEAWHTGWRSVREQMPEGADTAVGGRAG